MTNNLDEIRTALAAAMPGPWSFLDVPHSHEDMPITVAGKSFGAVYGIYGPTKVATGTLIANAPTWLATLCDEVEALRKWQTEALPCVRFCNGSDEKGSVHGIADRLVAQAKGVE